MCWGTKIAREASNYDSNVTYAVFRWLLVVGLVVLFMMVLRTRPYFPK